MWDAPRNLHEAIAFWTGAGYSGNFVAARVPAGLLEASWIVVAGPGRPRGRRGHRRPARPRPPGLCAARGGGCLAAACGGRPVRGREPGSRGATACRRWRWSPSWRRDGRAGWPSSCSCPRSVGGAAGGVRPRSRLVEARVEEALEALPPRAVLVAESDMTVGALSFLQTARAERPDVAWIGSGVAGVVAPWARLREQDPHLRPLPGLAPVPGDPRDRAIVALLALAGGRVPSFTEDSSLLRRGREWAGWVELGPGDATARGRWTRLRREARGDATARSRSAAPRSGCPRSSARAGRAARGGQRAPRGPGAATGRARHRGPRAARARRASSRSARRGLDGALRSRRACARARHRPARVALRASPGLGALARPRPPRGLGRGLRPARALRGGRGPGRRRPRHRSRPRRGAPGARRAAGAPLAPAR